VPQPSWLPVAAFAEIEPAKKGTPPDALQNNLWADGMFSLGLPTFTISSCNPENTWLI
jgi:hypothetical protein